MSWANVALQWGVEKRDHVRSCELTTETSEQTEGGVQGSPAKGVS